VKDKWEKFIEYNTINPYAKEYLFPDTYKVSLEIFIKKPKYIIEKSIVEV
jgi:hypothetical protein